MEESPPNEFWVNNPKVSPDYLHFTKRGFWYCQISLLISVRLPIGKYCHVSFMGHRVPGVPGLRPTFPSYLTKTAEVQLQLYWTYYDQAKIDTRGLGVPLAPESLRSWESWVLHWYTFFHVFLYYLTITEDSISCLWKKW